MTDILPVRLLTKLGIVASRQMQARLAPDVEIQDADYSLSNALYLLN